MALLQCEKMKTTMIKAITKITKMLIVTMIFKEGTVSSIVVGQIATTINAKLLI